MSVLLFSISILSSSGSLPIPMDTFLMLCPLGSSERRRTFPLMKDGSFIFYDVQAGSYLLDTEAMGFVFPTVRAIDLLLSPF